MATQLLVYISKKLPAMQETWVSPLGREDPLEKGMAAHSSSCLENPMNRGAWRAWSTGLQRAGHNWATNMQIFILVLYLVNILKTTELNTLKGSSLYVNFLAYNKRRGGERQMAARKTGLSPHSLPGSSYFKSHLHLWPHSQHRPRKSSFQFTLVWTESPSFTGKGISAITFAADKCHDFQKPSTEQCTQSCQQPQVDMFSLDHQNKSYFSAFTRTFISGMIGGRLP